jgi:hypothetical protein
MIFTFSNKDILRIGYSKNLIVLGITIDTLYKYLLLQAIIFFTEFLSTVLYEYASPIMYFNVFNNDKKIITEFGKIELQFYAQSVWFITGLKNGIMVLVSITQIDITICKIIYSELAMIIVIRNMLKDKIFIKEDKTNKYDINNYEIIPLNKNIIFEDDNIIHNRDVVIDVHNYVSTYIVCK